MKNNHKYIYLLIAAFTLLVFALSAIAAEENRSCSAIIMDAGGNVSLVRNGKKRGVGLGELLFSGDVVELAKDASLTINYLESGQQEQWPGGMKVVVGTAQSKHIPSGVLIANNKVVLPQLDSPQMGSFTLRGLSRPDEVKPESKIEVTGLSNTAILEQRPTFSWKPVNGADSYTVTLYLEPGAKFLWQSTTTEEALPYPQSEAPLTLGARYKWDVKGLKNRRVIAEKRSYFYLLKERDVAYLSADIARFQEELSRNAQKTATRLAFILFLENYRLYDAALTQYEIICATRSQSEAIRQRREKLLQIRYSNLHY